MTFTPREFYGGANSFSFEPITTYRIPDYTAAKVWVFESDDTLESEFRVRLPDAQTLRQTGWCHFVIRNATPIPIDIQSYDGVVDFETIPVGYVALIGLWSANTSHGEWVIRIRDSNSTVDFGPMWTIAYGGASGDEVFHCNTYSLVNDSWTARTDMTTQGADVTSANLGHTGRSFWHTGQVLREFDEDAHVVRANSLLEAEYSAFCWLGGTTVKLFKMQPHSFADSVSTVSSETYDATANTWSLEAACPFLINDARAVPIQVSPLAAYRPYIASGMPSNWAMFFDYNEGTEVFTTRPSQPTPQTHFAATLVGSGFLGHMQGGNASSSPPAYATYFHNVYYPYLQMWRGHPRLPQPARGQGAAVQSDNLGRYTFGMGASPGYPSTSSGHRQYDFFTLTYTERGVFSWGSRDRRENAWTQIARF